MFKNLEHAHGIERFEFIAGSEGLRRVEKHLKSLGPQSPHQDDVSILSRDLHAGIKAPDRSQEVTRTAADIKDPASACILKITNCLLEFPFIVDVVLKIADGFIESRTAR